MERNTKYLTETYYIDYNSSIVQETIKTLKKEVYDNVTLVKTFFDYVRDEIKYTIDISRLEPVDFKASTTLEIKKGFCIPKAIVLVALLRGVSIPARLHFTDLINHQISESLRKIIRSNYIVFHGYAEVYLGSKWLPLTPAFDRGLCEKQQWPICEFNSSMGARFPKIDDKGEPFIDYVNDRGFYADLPYDEIINTFNSYYSSAPPNK